MEEHHPHPADSPPPTLSTPPPQQAAQPMSYEDHGSHSRIGLDTSAVYEEVEAPEDTASLGKMDTGPPVDPAIPTSSSGSNGNSNNNNNGIGQSTRTTPAALISSTALPLPAQHSSSSSPSPYPVTSLAHYPPTSAFTPGLHQPLPPPPPPPPLVATTTTASTAISAAAATTPSSSPSYPAPPYLPAPAHHSTLPPPLSISHPIPVTPVQAYAKIEGDDLCFFLQDLEATIGRSSIPAQTQVSATAPSPAPDIVLGGAKSISRLHARILYNHVNRGFDLLVLGKNGAFVNEVYIASGSSCPLSHACKIQIANKVLRFHLPNGLEGEGMSGEETEEVEEEDEEEEGDEEEGSEEEEDDEGERIVERADEEEEEDEMSLEGRSTLPRPLGGSTGKVKSASRVSPLPSSHPPYLAQERRGKRSTSASSSSGHGKPSSSTTFDRNRYVDSKEKPPYSYASLIAQAITSVGPEDEDSRMTLSDIYDYISDHYPFYARDDAGWQNSIRHNLSLNKGFAKVPRAVGEPGKGSYWTILPQHRMHYVNGEFKARRASPSTGSKRKKEGNPADGANDSGATGDEDVDRSGKEVKRTGKRLPLPFTQKASS